MNTLHFSANFFVKRRFFFGAVITGSLLLSATLTSCSPHTQNRRRIPEARETKTAGEIITQMKGRLHLTEDEEVKVRPIIEEQVERRKELIKKYEGQGYKGMDSLKDELKDLRISTANQLQYFLTSDQMIKYGAMQQEEDQRISGEKSQTQQEEEIQKPRKGRGRRSGTF
jgi:hypothetical protein